MVDNAEFGVPWSGRGMLYDQGDIDAVVEAMTNADPQTQGRHQQAFERRFAELCHVRHAFAVSSCTAALELAAALCRLQPGDEVILPAHTFAASAIPFARTGARLVWADIDRDTRVISAETVAPLITPRTRVIVAVHLYGLVCAMDPLLDLARRCGARVVEDAAQALGAHDHGRPAGSMGDFGCFSFHTHKNITTLGEGGMLTVRDPDLAEKAPGLRHNGLRGFADDRRQYWLPAMSNVDADLDRQWPYNFCLGEAQCALGLRLLERVPAINAARAARARHFMAELSAFPELVFQTQPDGQGHSHHLLAARYQGPGPGRDALIELLAFRYGVKAVVQYCPLYRYPLFIKAGFGAAHCPNSDELFDNMVSFPFHLWQPEQQFLTMIEATRQALTTLRGLRAAGAELRRA